MFFPCIIVVTFRVKVTLFDSIHIGSRKTSAAAVISLVTSRSSLLSITVQIRSIVSNSSNLQFLRTEKHKALLKEEEWAKLPPKVQESPYFADGKLLFDAERLCDLLEKIIEVQDVSK